VLYTKGLTQEQVSEVFEQIYGQEYSKSSISRMVQSVRDQVSEWLDRSLESYYPVLFVDCAQSGSTASVQWRQRLLCGIGCDEEGRWEMRFGISSS